MIPSIVITLFDILLVVAIVLCLIRMIKGPGAADRMVAIDLLGLLIAVLMIAHVIRSGDETVLDVVLVFSVIAFFGTVALAHYLQRESSNPSDKS
ncbi:cation:proton antiporter [Ruficoccus amylovorans]|uniref:Cation:proton antiporter n=1 Tax=Ruficoccus amylovorans TaxID=1804625 RepID=A0A842HFT0_9BACT|nr:monovalent cation/H+ antiporter complex subunit F [Ruficoccus amylovorans]MBC2595262.1 cation:proton antiporter [Ruficoccus amylovorans]